MFENDILLYVLLVKMLMKSKDRFCAGSFIIFWKTFSLRCPFSLLAQCSFGKKATTARKAKYIACKRSGASKGTSYPDFTRGIQLPINIHMRPACSEKEF